MRLPLNIIYFVASCWQVARCALLWCDTNGSCCLQKDLVEGVTVSDTACYVTVLLIQTASGPLPKFSNSNTITRVLPHCVHKSRFKPSTCTMMNYKRLLKPCLTLKLLSAYKIDDLSWVWTILEKARLMPILCIRSLISNRKISFFLNSVVVILYK